MRPYREQLVAWGSAIVLGYLASVLWLDALARLVSGGSAGLTWLVALATVVISLRALWIRTLRAAGLSALAAGGLLAAWHPWLIVPLCAAAVGSMALIMARPGDANTLLGRRLGWLWPVRLTTEDRFLHCHVLGPTGSGKSSSVLMPLAAQDIRMGHGLVLMDPKGDLADAAYRVARESGRRIIRVNPAEPSCPHYNPLDGPASQVAEGIAWCLDQLSDGGHPYYRVAARIMLLHSVRAIKAANPADADLGTLLTFLRDDRIQKQIVQASGDQAAQQYFREQWARRSGSSREDRQGLVNRLELLWANPDVRRVLTGVGDFTWKEVLDDRWVVLCTLPLAELGATARALGSLLWHGLAQAAYGRNPAHDNPPAFLYLDEFHQWVSEDLSDFLALARGYRVGLVLAHQDMGQLSPALAEAVTANARQRIILGGTAADDIDRFLHQAAPYLPARPVRYLPRGQAMVQLNRRGSLNRPILVHLPHHPLGGGGAHAI